MRKFDLCLETNSVERNSTTEASQDSTPDTIRQLEKTNVSFSLAKVVLESISHTDTSTLFRRPVQINSDFRLWDVPFSGCPSIFADLYHPAQPSKADGEICARAADRPPQAAAPPYGCRFCRRMGSFVESYFHGPFHAPDCPRHAAAFTPTRCPPPSLADALALRGRPARNDTAPCCGGACLSWAPCPRRRPCAADSGPSPPPAVDGGGSEEKKTALGAADLDISPEPPPPAESRREAAQP